MMRPIVISALAATLFAACGGGSGGGGGGQDLSQEEQQEALLAIANFAAEKQIFFYDMMSMLSAGYTVPLFEAVPTGAEFSAFLDQADALVASHTAMALALGTDPEEIPGLRRQALSVPESWIGASLINSIISAGPESRERILTVISNMEAHEQEAVVDELTTEWKTTYGIDSFPAFVSKLESGALDVVAERMFDHLSLVGEKSLFSAYAQDKGLTRGAIIHKKGAELAKAGGELLIDTASLLVPGVGKAKELLEKANDFEEGVKDLYDDPKGAALDLMAGAVKDKVVEKLAGFVDVDGAVDAGTLGEDAGTAVKWCMNVATGTDDPEDWVEGAVDKGAALFSEAMQADPPEIVTATRSGGAPAPAEPAVVIQLQTSAAPAKGMVLPTGNWEISGTSEGPGEAVTETDVSVTPGGTVEVIPEEPEQPGPGADTSGGADVVESGEDTTTPGPVPCDQTSSVSGSSGTWHGMKLDFTIDGVAIEMPEQPFVEHEAPLFLEYVAELPVSHTVTCPVSVTMTADASGAFVHEDDVVYVHLYLAQSMSDDLEDATYLSADEETAVTMSLGPGVTDPAIMCLSPNNPSRILGTMHYMPATGEEYVIRFQLNRVCPGYFGDDTSWR